MADKAATQEAEADKADTEDKSQAKAGADDAGGDGDKADEIPEIEVRARRMGWRPEAEYVESGRDKAHFVDAEEFVRRGEESLPVLRERLRKQENIIASQDKKMEEGNKLLRELVSHQQTQTKAAVEKAVRELKAERREAASTGDADKVEELSAEIEKTEKSLVKAEKAEEKAEEKSTVPPEVVAWAEANPWFKKDRVLNQLATAVYGDLMEDDSLTETQRLAKVKAEVIKRYPEKFPGAKRETVATVESGQGGSGRRTMAKGWADIPAEERQLAQRLIRQGACKNEAEYAKLYWQQSQSAA